MRILYPYNEILPKKKAHDVFVFQECAALSSIGFDVNLLCGRGSLMPKRLFAHYGLKPNDLRIKYLPIVRKNNLLNLSWNLPFFFFTQRQIKKLRPDFVFLSVLKQGAYHLKRKQKGVRYLYEVHELGFYPNGTYDKSRVEQEKAQLEIADLITVTTNELKEILLSFPYSLTNRIEVVELAVNTKPLPAPKKRAPLTIFFVGQLYKGQGVEDLILAMSKTQGVHLKIIGGKAEEISALKALGSIHNVSDRVTFLGFKKPEELSSLVEEAHAFVAPFQAIGRMPYVAHTKLCEYAAWGRPIVAPDLSLVREHLSRTLACGSKGAVLYTAGNIEALAAALQSLTDDTLLNQLQQEIMTLSHSFTWEKRAEKYASILNS